VKNPSRRWLWLVLVVPGLIVLAGLLLVGRSRVESASGNGIVALGFTSTITTSDGRPVPAEWQRILLNVIAVRMHPSTDLTLSDAAAGWVTIPAPPAIGSENPSQFINTSLNFGGSGTLLTAASSVLQLDLMTLQNLPVFVNAAAVGTQTYGQVELLLNSSAAGNVVPLCPPALPAGEGCITYPAQLASAAGLRVQFANGFPVLPGISQQLIINLGVGVGPPPAADPNKTIVFLNPIITPRGNLLPTGATFDPALGSVSGTAENVDLNNTTVAAEYAGTNQIVASTKLLADGTFIMSLPAAAAPNSTLYDFFVSGGGGYLVRSRVPVSSQGTGASPPPTTDLGVLVVPGSSMGSITGFISDGCNGTAVQGATLQLLVPDTTVSGGPNTCNLVGSPPAIPSNCVVVSTTASDDQGHYPLPGGPFTQIAVTPPPTVPFYDLEITAAGFNTTVQPVTAGSLSCPGSRFANSCSFGLEHGFLSGATALSSRNNTGHALNSLVMAEDAGTDNIESVALSTIRNGGASAPFTISVPLAGPSSGAIPVANFDLLATVQDLFQGAPQQISGHQIGVAASVGAPVANCSTLGVRPLSPMDCVGLASVDGSATEADPNTTSVRLSKAGVQIMETEPNSIGVGPNGDTYNFCAPSDSYFLTRYESGVAQSSAPVLMAKPLAVPTPCGSICQGGNRSGTCLICQPVTAEPLP
jgi:hypothetical protein